MKTTSCPSNFAKKNALVYLTNLKILNIIKIKQTQLINALSQNLLEIVLLLYQSIFLIHLVKNAKNSIMVRIYLKY
jgi:hypothetical protein